MQDGLRENLIDDWNRSAEFRGVSKPGRIRFGVAVVELSDFSHVELADSLCVERFPVFMSVRVGEGFDTYETGEFCLTRDLEFCFGRINGRGDL